MKPAVTYPDAEHLVRVYLAEQLASIGEICTVATGVPDNWTRDSIQHVQVSSDGTPDGNHPMVAHVSVRLVAWAHSTSEAKHLAALAQGVLLANTGGVFAATHFLSGVLPARDPQTNAEIAATTSRVSVRSIPIEPVGS